MSQALELSWDFVEAASAAQFEALQANAPKAAPCADKGAHRDARRTGVMRDDPSTWDNERWPRGVEGGILPYFGAGQSKCAWYVRGKKAVRDVLGLPKCLCLPVRFEYILVHQLESEPFGTWKIGTSNFNMVIPYLSSFLIQ